MTVSKLLPVGTRVRVRGHEGRQGVVVGRSGGVLDAHVVLIGGATHQVPRSDMVEDRIRLATVLARLRR